MQCIIITLFRSSRISTEINHIRQCTLDIKLDVDACQSPTVASTKRVCTYQLLQSRVAGLERSAALCSPWCNGTDWTARPWNTFISCLQHQYCTPVLQQEPPRKSASLLGCLRTIRKCFDHSFRGPFVIASHC